MWQSKQTALTKFGVAFLLVYALLVQKPQTGFELNFSSNNISVPENDLTLAHIYSKPQIKLAAATPKPTQKPQPTPQVASISIEKLEPTETINLIKKYANESNLDEEIMIKIAECESGFDTNAVNGQYAGIYQFHPSTWESNRNAMGENPDTSLRFDPEESIKTAAFKMKRDGYSAWPACQSYAQESLALK